MTPLVQCPRCKGSSIDMYSWGDFWCNSCKGWQIDTETTEEFHARQKRDLAKWRRDERKRTLRMLQPDKRALHRWKTHLLNL